MKFRRLILSLALIALTATGALANWDKSCSSFRDIAADEVRSLPTFLAEQRVQMAGRVNDLFGFAQTALVPGVVEDNAYFFAQHLEVDGSILGDLYSFSQTLSLDGDIGGDLYCWGGEIDIAEGAELHGNMLFGAGLVSIDGKVAGKIRGGAGEVYINGDLLQGAEIEVGSLRLGPNAHVVGDLIYSAAEEAEVDPGAVIEGDLVFREDVVVIGGDYEDESEEEAGGFGFWDFLQWIAAYAGAFILGAVLLALLGKRARKPSAAMARRPGVTLGVGFLVFVVTPISAMIAILLILPMPLGLLSLLLYIAGLLLAGLVVSLWLGGWLLGRMGREGEPGYGALALGLLVIGLLGMIPYLGFLVKLIMLVAGLGGIFLVLTGKDRNGKVPATAI
jgi:cytoskeletal protein CcmA (bactofilin family)